MNLSRTIGLIAIVLALALAAGHARGHAAAPKALAAQAEVEPDSK